MGRQSAAVRMAWRGVVAGALAGWMMAAQAARAQVQDAETAHPRDLNESLRSIIQAHDLPALAVIARRGGEIVAQGAVGVRRAGSEKSISLDDLWHIGSCAKSMTATLAARLVEAGTIAWDTTIGQSLGEVDAISERILPAYRDVTLRQLLAHRSGLPEDRDPDPALWPRVLALKGPMIQQRREAAALVLAQPPAAEPGSSMAYSNFGYVVAAAMMEQAASLSWEELIRSHVFEPLGMPTAGFGPPGADSENHEQVMQPYGHRLQRGRQQPVEPWSIGADNPPVLRPAGGVHLSLSDWAKYAEIHLAGARGQGTPFLKADSWQVLHADEYGQDYALGWALGRRGWAGGGVLSHSGSNRMWMAVIWLAPVRDLAVMAVTNCGGEGASTGCDEAVVAALQALDLLPLSR